MNVNKVWADYTRLANEEGAKAGSKVLTDRESHLMLCARYDGRADVYFQLGKIQELIERHEMPVDAITPPGIGYVPISLLKPLLAEVGAASPATPALDVFQRIFHVANLALGEPPATRMADTGALVEIAMLAEQALKAQR